MLALVKTPSAPIPVELREVAEPEPAADEAIVEVHAFSVNRGEVALLANRPEGWQPGQDIAGIIIQAAADGSGPKEGTRVMARRVNPSCDSPERNDSNSSWVKGMATRVLSNRNTANSARLKPQVSSGQIEKV